jgi:hypothetical protein
MLSVMSKRRLAGMALVLALGATGVACEGEVDVDSGENGEEGGSVEGEVDVEGGEQEGEE